MNVTPKKYLGQHFLTDLNIAKKIAHSLQSNTYNTIVEVGPGMGVLTQFLLKERTQKIFVVELDKESVTYLNHHFPELQHQIIAADFLKINLKEKFLEPIAIIGNFPYNISSQILFKVLDNRTLIPEFAGMFQKEVSKRITASAGSKIYGILSVLIQAYYQTEYLFTVSEQVFNPPPKVKSGVIRLNRFRTTLPCKDDLFRQIVKMAFNQRRKTLKNSLKSLLKTNIKEEILSKRPEVLSVDEFIYLTNLIDNQIIT